MAPPPLDPLRHALDRDGFVVIPDVLPPAEVARSAAAFDRLLEVGRSLPGPGMHRGAHFVLEPAPFRLHRVVWCAAVEPDLDRLGRDPRIAGLAARALGVEHLVQIISQAHFKLPGDGVAYPWHQDASHRRFGTPEWHDVDGRGSFVEVAVAVDAMTRDNGPLRVVPGSHRRGYAGRDADGALPPGTFDPADAVDVELPAGSAVIFGPFLVHGSEPNRSEQPRRLFLNGFALPGANRRAYPGCGLGRAVTRS